MEKLKIGITCYPTLGGSGVVATELGKLLAEKGHEVHFITFSIPFRLGKFYRNISFHEVEVNNYSVFRYPPYDLQLASKMAQVVRMARLDILHVHYAIPHSISAYLAKQLVKGEVKVVTTLHGTDITILGHDQTLASLIRFGIDESDAVTAVSRSLIQETRELLDIKRPIELIYNFVDRRVFYRKVVEDLRKELAPNGEKILLHISNFRKVKRPEDVIRIFARVQREMPAKLVLIGDGPELPCVQRLIASCRLEEEVYFLGEREDVAEILSLADCLLLPSEKESFGLVALEAMACGVPVVASTAGGIPEVVVHGETGFLAPVGDVEQMAQYVYSLLQDEALWQEMSGNAIARAHGRFSAENILPQYEALYRRLLDRG